MIKLTRNKILYENSTNNESFSDRLVMFFIHFAFFLKLFKNQAPKNELQDLYDFIFKQIELSIREIGYGDATINKKMKLYVNLMHSIINKIDEWEFMNTSQKAKFFSNFVDVNKDSTFLVNYFNKYALYLSKKSLNYFTKDVISLKF